MKIILTHDYNMRRGCDNICNKNCRAYSVFKKRRVAKLLYPYKHLWNKLKCIIIHKNIGEHFGCRVWECQTAANLRKRRSLGHWGSLYPFNMTLFIIKILVSSRPEELHSWEHYQNLIRNKFEYRVLSICFCTNASAFSDIYYENERLKEVTPNMDIHALKKRYMLHIQAYGKMFFGIIGIPKQ